MVRVNETRARGSSGTGGALRARAPESPLDDWLGDVSDDDWSEEATRHAQDRGATRSQDALPPSEPGRRSPPADRATRDGTAAGAGARAVVRRRRLVAGVLLALGVAGAVVIPLHVLRGGGEAPAPTVSAPTAQTPAPEDRPSEPATTTPSTTTPSPTTPSTTTPSTGGTAFTLPEGTKLQLGGENDAGLVRALQLALTKAGYDPGPGDGTFGPQTEAAVVAFQQDNGLSVDGRVGPETAAALANALAGG